MTDKRPHPRETFDAVAERYDAARPGYPTAVFGDVVALSGIPSGGRILEIGPGTGHATMPFAERNYRIDGIELGSRLADLARKRLAAFPTVTIEVGSFDTHEIPESTYDLVMAASSFHWLDPETRLPRIAAALKPGGALAVWRNNRVRGTASYDFWEAARPIYERIAPRMRASEVSPVWPADLNLRDFAELIEESELFTVPTVRSYPWHVRYDTRSYIEALDTYSAYRTLDEGVRDQLFAELATLIDQQFDGTITRDLLTVLTIAHRQS